MNDSYQLDQQRWSKRSESPNSTSLCRLVIIKSPFYAPGSVALLSQTSSVSIGRDRDYGLRIRLKEIEVSKTHSLLFYFEGAYAVTDCGSMHGTFIEREGKEKQRLSESRKASKPFELHNNE